MFWFLIASVKTSFLQKSLCFRIPVWLSSFLLFAAPPSHPRPRLPSSQPASRAMSCSSLPTYFHGSVSYVVTTATCEAPKHHSRNPHSEPPFSHHIPLVISHLLSYHSPEFLQRDGILQHLEALVFSLPYGTLTLLAPFKKYFLPFTLLRFYMHGYV